MSTLNFVTHNPLQFRNQNFLSILRKYWGIRVVKPLFWSEDLLATNPKTVLKLFSLASQLIFIDGIVHFDDIALFAFPFLRSSRFVLDFRCPLSLEMKWLGLHPISALTSLLEGKASRTAHTVTAPNEHLATIAKKYGAKRTYVIPNYPSRVFVEQPTIPNIHSAYGLQSDTKIAFFAGAGRLFEIYGLDLLLRSWRIIERDDTNSTLVIAAPIPSDSWASRLMNHYGVSNVKFVGWVNKQQLASWIRVADICLAPRTPGFPSKIYNDKDSCKISEYAAFRKPIVASGYAPSDQYLLTSRTPAAFAEGIHKALRGDVPIPEPHFWEEKEKLILQIYSSL